MNPLGSKWSRPWGEGNGTREYTHTSTLKLHYYYLSLDQSLNQIYNVTIKEPNYFFYVTLQKKKKNNLPLLQGKLKPDFSNCRFIKYKTWTLTAKKILSAVSRAEESGAVEKKLSLEGEVVWV